MTETLGYGARARVVRDGDSALKLYAHDVDKAEVFYEAYVHALIEPTGLPIAQVLGVEQHAGQCSLRLALIKGTLLGDAFLQQPAEGPLLLQRFVELQLRIHRQHAALPYRLKTTLHHKLAQLAGQLPADRLQQLQDQLAALPDGDALCHGDYHPRNVIVNDSGLHVIDWFDATLGDARADACRSYLILLTHAQPLAAPYLECYCASAGVADAEVLCWLPVLAAAKLTEGLADEHEALLAILNQA
ncbi:hypothetical protein IGB42_03793 [Andreprevotia sp. IGB-42]|uniref:phosphotransferase family protein n=1 Tax=Andreprevotia sp. IGB-42 TaxID=2497473 RepID=UPI00135C63B7|nr:aminoglycoside phosphotransferase family protein [Andreprevotia sp. IGB-42]KAF0811776.1 hypothetical protein IGB42_03793 [Andreprevotia sp. IGB-42]